MAQTRTKRRAARITGKEQAVILMLRGLASKIEDGTASANVRIEIERDREIWLLAAAVRR